MKVILDPTATNSTTPIPVRSRNSQPPMATFPTFTAISAGGRHTCAIANGGAVFCWGDGSRGQRGDNSTQVLDLPVAVVGGLTFKEISAGGLHTCGITTSDAAYCWGDNTGGQLGTGTAGGFQSAPTQVSGGLLFRSISASEQNTCGITTSGRVYCWGNNRYAQVGNGIQGGTLTPVTVPAPVGQPLCQPHDAAACQWSGPFTAVSLSTGRRHVCAIATDGNTYCWGSNVFGALGDEFQAAIREVPVLVATPR